MNIYDKLVQMAPSRYSRTRYGVLVTTPTASVENRPFKWFFNREFIGCEVWVNNEYLSLLTEDLNDTEFTSTPVINTAHLKVIDLEIREPNKA